MARCFEPLYFNSYVSVRANRQVYFERCINSHILPSRSASSGVVKKVISNNTLTDKAVKRLQDAINLLVNSAKSKRLYSSDLKSYFNFKVNFITLTLPSPQVHTDKEIHDKIFKDFIRTWKRKNKGLLYIYKAEVQDNGNLHYHLTTNSFIHHSKLRKMWNRSANLLGYVDRSSSDNPNSTDVHAVKNIKNIAAYLSSYCTKKDLYKAPLKRYHKKYKKILLDPTRTQFDLPRNYFCLLKRKVLIKLWDASKVLLQKPYIINLSAAPPSFFNIDEIKSITTKVCQYEYCKIAYLNTFKLPAHNAVLKAYREHLAGLDAYHSQVAHILN